VNIEGLRYFIELSQTGSFNRAAKNLFITQQGLNKAISSIENALGFKIIERRHKGVRLTQEGKIVLAHAKSSPGDYDAMISEAIALGRKELADSTEALTLISHAPPPPFIADIKTPPQTLVQGRMDSFLILEPTG
jgi:DNA-binding transcriptional LysR family regulator